MLTQKELAAALGLSGAMVSKLAARGMPTDSAELAKRWRNRNLQRGRTKGVRIDTKPAPPTLDDTQKQPREKRDDDHDGELFYADDRDPEEREMSNLRQARERKEHYSAELSRLEFEKQIGKLMQADEVIFMLENAGTEMRLALEALPGRIAPQVVGRTESEIASVMAYEVEHCLSALAQRFEVLAQQSESVQS